MTWSVNVRNVSLRFGGVTALTDVSLDVADRGVHALVGPNGAGKTSLLNCVNRIYRPTTGDILLFGESSANLTTVAIARRGIARTFQHAEIVRDLTVVENAMVGASRWQRGLRGERAARRAALDALDQVGLGAHVDRRPQELSYGLRKRIELARVLATRPRLLLLDEPTAGLTDDEIDELRALVAELAVGTPVMLVAHHMEFVMSVADRITVLDRGEVLTTDAPAAVGADTRVREAYLGLGNQAARELRNEGIGSTDG